MPLVRWKAGRGGACSPRLVWLPSLYPSGESSTPFLVRLSAKLRPVYFHRAYSSLMRRKSPS